MTRTTLACLLLAAGCTAQATPDLLDGELHRVEEGKEDNYYSNVAYEYDVTGSVDVPMTAAEYENETTRADLVTRRLTAVAAYLTGYMTDKFRGIDENNDGEITEDEVFFHNEGYGGFSSMVRSYTVAPSNVHRDGDAVRVDFRLVVAGPPDLLTRVPGMSGASGGVTFELKMPKGASVDPRNIPRQDIVRRFDPRSYEGDLETHNLTLAQRAQVGNAYPQFAAMMDDGVFDVTLFYGHDYNTSRSDISEAREAFETLKELGFRAPVEDFDDLKSDSGAFTRTAKANGEEVLFEVRIYHSNMFETARRAQHDLALSELVARDVFFYNGHAGPYYGFYLDEHDAAKVWYSEFATLPFQRDRQQLAIAQGCQTYSNYADMLYASEAKDEGNLDVITTVNYSYGQGTMEIVRNLLKFDRSGNHQPVDFYKIVADLNSNWTNRSRNVFYGVMGIEGNPQLHPYANANKIGEACTRASQCGDASGNVCVSRRCAAVSLAAEACPAGTRFDRLASGSTIVGGACFRE